MKEEVEVKSNHTLASLRQYMFKESIPHACLEDFWIEADIVRLLDEKIVRKHMVMPLRIQEDQLILAMENPYDLCAIEEVQFLTKLKVYPVVEHREELKRVIDYYYSQNQTQLAVEEAAVAFSTPYKENKTTVDEKVIQEAPVVKMVNSIIRQAICLGASDIHIEPFKEDTRIRMRIDGQLLEERRLGKCMHEPMVTRLKIVGKMDIAEKRLPQDGQWEWEKEQIAIRLASMPTLFGEKMVLRILQMDKDSIQPLKSLGLSESQMKEINDLLKLPSGIILITGATGSGKSTTLYALLDERKNNWENVMTLEDPVEKRIEGIGQVSIHPKAGLTFSRGLRALLRQDPDVLMIGEIRDVETVDIAFKAALTGHLILSTLHTGSAVSTIMRLFDMGQEPYKVAAALKGVIAQRLVRKLCEHCKSAYTASPEEKEILGVDGFVKLYRDEGCPQCKGTGYRGRKGVFEVLKIDGAIKQMIHEKHTLERIQQYLDRRGDKSIQHTVRQMVLDGETTIETYLKYKYAID